MNVWIRRAVPVTVFSAAMLLGGAGSAYADGDSGGNLLGAGHSGGASVGHTIGVTGVNNDGSLFDVTSLRENDFSRDWVDRDMDTDVDDHDADDNDADDNNGASGSDNGLFSFGFGISLG